MQELVTVVKREERERERESLVVKLKFQNKNEDLIEETSVENEMMKMVFKQVIL